MGAKEEAAPPQHLKQCGPSDLNVISRREFDDPLSLGEQKAIRHYHERFRTGASAGGC
jgi:hypothetical protein